MNFAPAQLLLLWLLKALLTDCMLLCCQLTALDTAAAQQNQLCCVCSVQSIHRHWAESTRDAHEKHETVPSQKITKRGAHAAYTRCVWSTNISVQVNKMVSSLTEPERERVEQLETETNQTKFTTWHANCKVKLKRIFEMNFKLFFNE